MSSHFLLGLGRFASRCRNSL